MKLPEVRMGPENDLLAVFRDDVGPIRVRDVVAGTADDDVQHRRVVERVHYVVARTAEDLVGSPIEERTIVHDIITIAAVRGIAAQGTRDLIVARSSGDPVVSAAAKDLVVTRATDNFIVASGAKQRRIAGEQVVASEPDYGVVIDRAFDSVGTPRCRSGPPPSPPRSS